MISHFKRIFSKSYVISVFYITKFSLRTQYQNSFFGILWSLIQPLVFVGVTSVVFSIIMRFPFADHLIYMTSGVVTWNFFVNSVNTGSTSLVRRESLLKKCIVSKTIFPVADVSGAFFVFTISILVVLILINGIIFHKLYFSVLYLPIAILPLFITCICTSILLAYLTPYFRDISHLVNVALNVIFWTMPVAYPLEIIPEAKRIFFEYNPIYLLISPIQDVMYYGHFPTPIKFLLAFTVAGIAFLIALFTYAKLRKKVIYYL
ncbi:MAG: ABC transporter permease [Sphingobacteriia bacterium]|nr:ABC transporter permease [Sphingobacteriia bacterium]